MKDKFINFVFSFVYRIVMAVVIIFLGVFCLTHARFSETKLLPDCASTAPYTSMESPPEELHLDYLETKDTDDKKVSIKAYYPVESTLKTINESFLFKIIKMTVTDPNTINISYYFGSILKSTTLDFFTIQNTLFSFVNGTFPEWLIILTAPYILMVVYGITAIYAGVKCFFLFFFNLYMFYQEKTVETVNGEPQAVFGEPSFGKGMWERWNALFTTIIILIMVFLCGFMLMGMSVGFTALAGLVAAFAPIFINKYYSDEDQIEEAQEMAADQRNQALKKDDNDAESTSGSSSGSGSDTESDAGSDLGAESKSETDVKGSETPEDISAPVDPADSSAEIKSNTEAEVKTETDAADEAKDSAAQSGGMNTADGSAPAKTEYVELHDNKWPYHNPEEELVKDLKHSGKLSAIVERETGRDMTSSSGSSKKTEDKGSSGSSSSSSSSSSKKEDSSDKESGSKKEGSGAKSDSDTDSDSGSSSGSGSGSDTDSDSEGSSGSDSDEEEDDEPVFSFVRHMRAFVLTYRHIIMYISAYFLVMDISNHIGGRMAFVTAFILAMLWYFTDLFKKYEVIEGKDNFTEGVIGFIKITKECPTESDDVDE